MATLDLRDGDLRLRPLVVADFELLLGNRDGEVGSHSGGEEAARRRLERKIERSGRFQDGRLDLGIEWQRRLVGTIEARQPRGGLPTGVFELGISLFDAADRGRGVGRRATELLTSWLFSDATTHRVQASTDIANSAMRRVLERLGFVEEGVMRGFMPAPDGPRDYVLYGVTREEWAARR